MASKDNGRLPLTRKEQIWYLLKNEIGILFLANFVSFLFVIPLILVFFFGVTTFHHYSLDDTKTSMDFFLVFLSNGLLFIPAVVILGLGRAGLNGVIKQLVFESSAKFLTFFKSIFKNFKVFFSYYLLLGILSGLLIINFGYFRYIEGNIIFKGILLGANILLLLTMLIATSNIEFEGTTFNNYLFAYYRNGIYLFYKGFPLSLINLLLIILPIIAIMFTPISLFFIPLGVLATFYISLSSLICFIIQLYIFEKVVPKENISEIYHKGLEDINL